MELPKVNAVGLIEYPEEYVALPRQPASRGRRLLAGLFLLVFLAATVFSTAWSLGGYCLTSDGGDTRALAHGLSAHLP